MLQGAVIDFGVGRQVIVRGLEKFVKFRHVRLRVVPQPPHARPVQERISSIDQQWTSNCTRLNDIFRPDLAFDKAGDQCFCRRRAVLRGIRQMTSALTHCQFAPVDHVTIAEEAPPQIWGAIEGGGDVRRVGTIGEGERQQHHRLPRALPTRNPKLIVCVIWVFACSHARIGACARLRPMCVCVRTCLFLYVCACIHACLLIEHDIRSLFVTRCVASLRLTRSDRA